MSIKPEVGNLIPIDLFNSCSYSDSLFAGMTLTLHKSQVHIRGGCRGAIASLKLTKVTLFTMIFYNSENSIRDIRPFCCPLFCNSSVVKYTSYFLQYGTRSETWLPSFTEISTLTLQAGYVPGSLFWCYVVMSLQFTHVRSLACKGRLRNLPADCSTASGLF